MVVFHGDVTSSMAGKSLALGLKEAWENLKLAKIYQTLQDGAPKIAKLPYKWLYGRYNYS